MNWFACALIAATGFAAYSLLVRVALKDGGDASAFALLLNTFVALTLPLLVALDAVTIALTGRAVVLLVLASGLDAAASILFIRGRQLEEVCRVALAREATTVWVFAGGVLLLGEALTPTKVLGLALILGGAATALWCGHCLRVTAGLTLIFWGGLCAAAASLAAKTIVDDNLSPALYLSALSGLAAVWLFALLPHRGRRIAAEFRHQGWRLAAIGLATALSGLFLLKAYQVGEASQVGPVYDASLVMTVLAGVVLPRERHDARRKFAGVARVLAGVALVRAA